MKTAILGTMAGVALGTIGALAYSHYLGDGKSLADLQAQLDAANANLAKIDQDKKQLAQETTGASTQVEALQTENFELKKQVEDLKNASPSTAASAPADTQQQNNLQALARMMAGAFRGGPGGGPQQRMLLLKTRLKLSSDQEAQIKAAMDADNQKRREMMQQMFRNGGKIDPSLAADANKLDQTMNAILTPEQQAAYKQVQADETAARANTMATIQVNQIAPLLQLSDAQKDQIFNSLYQVSSSTPDPATLFTNPNAATAFASQAQTMQSAMVKALTPDQFSLYQQQLAITPQFGGGRRGQNGNGGGGAAVGTTAGGYTVAPATTVTGYVSNSTPQLAASTTQVATPAAVPATTTTSDASAATATNAPAADATTNAPAATTNAPPAQ